jgi:hypothetical protein
MAIDHVLVGNLPLHLLEVQRLRDRKVH